jgi:hypothetical protein
MRESGPTNRPGFFIKPGHQLECSLLLEPSAAIYFHPKFLQAIVSIPA